MQYSNDSYCFTPSGYILYIKTLLLLYSYTLNITLKVELTLNGLSHLHRSHFNELIPNKQFTIQISWPASDKESFKLTFVSTNIEPEGVR